MDIRYWVRYGYEYQVQYKYGYGYVGQNGVSEQPKVWYTFHNVILIS